MKQIFLFRLEKSTAIGEFGAHATENRQKHRVNFILNFFTFTLWNWTRKFFVRFGSMITIIFFILFSSNHFWWLEHCPVALLLVKTCFNLNWMCDSSPLVTQVTYLFPQMLQFRSEHRCYVISAKLKHKIFDWNKKSGQRYLILNSNSNIIAICHERTVFTSRRSSLWQLCVCNKRAYIWSEPHKRCLTQWMRPMNLFEQSSQLKTEPLDSNWKCD